jgi:hypothetical protein
LGWNGGYGYGFNNWYGNNWGWNGGFGWNNWYEIIGAGTTGVGMAVLDGITGMATIGAGTIGDIQIIITTETMLITPAEEALLMQTITL